VPTGLQGRLVVEMAEGIAGPFCGQVLAELGARVVKVEPPDGDWSRTTGPPFLDEESPLFLAINRGKESLAADLKTDAGLATIRDLIGRADVVIVGYRPGVAERFGLGPELCAEHPRLIHTTISGYGNRGPLRERPGSDTILQAYAGIMSITGAADGPPMRVGTALADTSCGIYAALGTMSLLLAREHTGRGGAVDTSLLEALVHLQATTWAGAAAGATPRRMGARSGLSAVPAEAFPTADGHMMISCHGARQWKRLCAAVGRPEWETDPRMATNSDRVENHDYVIETIAATTRTRGVAEWMEVFEAEGVNAGPIQTFADLAADAQVEALGLLRRQAAGAYPEFGFVAAPLTFDGATEADELPPPPRLGEHNEALAAELADG
jgi:crotonobetainyl-CoA:carnitine CoA-transferase CaiB-like acyl-CoA transferase